MQFEYYELIDFLKENGKDMETQWLKKMNDYNRFHKIIHERIGLSNALIRDIEFSCIYKSDDVTKCKNHLKKIRFMCEKARIDNQAHHAELHHYTINK
jgi:hypothetical protein